MKINVGDKVKTVLNLSACPIVCQAKGEIYDKYPAYYHRWIVKEIQEHLIILENSKGEISKSDLDGNLLDEWIGHVIYKITKTKWSVK